MTDMIERINNDLQTEAASTIANISLINYIGFILLRKRVVTVRTIQFGGKTVILEVRKG
ncbi:hypothetical protein PALU110988_29345 [Paenibacillus lupini]|uniref:hypothetical protein n=1 Tax=Paenibacillus lupini TaxID=1450204 RepID=UPI0014243B1D|nr:hypothetical protein [Paenibacillus lupini]NIK23219.1 hypothetical protein [Paenibacillus lupini]